MNYKLNRHLTESYKSRLFMLIEDDMRIPNVDPAQPVVPLTPEQQAVRDKAERDANQKLLDRHKRTLPIPQEYWPDGINPANFYPNGSWPDTPYYDQDLGNGYRQLWEWLGPPRSEFVKVGYPILHPTNSKRFLPMNRRPNFMVPNGWQTYSTTSGGIVYYFARDANGTIFILDNNGTWVTSETHYLHLIKGNPWVNPPAGGIPNPNYVEPTTIDNLRGLVPNWLRRRAT